MSRFPIALPPPGSPARLPALLVPLLAGLAVLQLALPNRPELPPEGAVANLSLPRPAAEPPPVAAPEGLARRNPFTPSAAVANAPVDALAGAVIGGTVTVGRTRRALVTMPDRTLRYLPVGAEIAGWRIATLGPATALLVRGPEKLSVTYGQPARIAPPGATHPEETEQ